MSTQVFSNADHTQVLRLAFNDNTQAFTFSAVDGAVGVTWDSITLGYTGSLLTSVIYKLSGTTVRTLTLGYTSGNLTSVSKS